MCTYFVCSSLFPKYFQLCAWKVWLSPRLRNQAVFYARLLSEPGDTSDWEDEKSGMPFGFCLLSKIASCGRTRLHNYSSGAFGLDSRNSMRADRNQKTKFFWAKILVMICRESRQTGLLVQKLYISVSISCPLGGRTTAFHISAKTLHQDPASQQNPGVQPQTLGTLPGGHVQTLSPNHTWEQIKPKFGSWV